MPKNVDQMMRTGIDPEELTIEHVRNRRERMPVLRMNVGKCPSDSVPAQSGANMRVVVNIKRIVVVDELMARGLGKHAPGNRNQKRDDD